MNFFSLLQSLGTPLPLIPIECVTQALCLPLHLLKKWKQPPGGPAHPSFASTLIGENRPGMSLLPASHLLSSHNLWTHLGHPLPQNTLYFELSSLLLTNQELPDLSELFHQVEAAGNSLVNLHLGPLTPHSLWASTPQQ